MTNTKLLIVIGVMLLIVGVILYVLFGRGGSKNDGLDDIPVITNYEECVAAGFPILESDPPQCMANGKTYMAGVTEINHTIVVDTPLADDLVSSPMTITGKAQGFWYFEGEFPVYLYDDRGDEIGKGFVTAQGDWMTEDFVPFTGSLTFEEPTTPGGRVFFTQSDPSGMQENLQEFMMLVRFE